MKLSQIILPLTTGSVLFLAGCNETPRRQLAQRCVDNQGRVVDDQACEDEARRPGYGHAGFPYAHHWYWGGPSSYVPNGAVVRGGSYYAPPAETVEVFSPGVSGPRPTSVATSPSTAAARGLFGSSARAFGEAGVGE
jgi:hypothetical protein